jgi:hypothetical protein
MLLLARRIAKDAEAARDQIHRCKQYRMFNAALPRELLVSLKHGRLLIVEIDRYP